MTTTRSKTFSEIRLDRGIGCATELEPARHGNTGDAAIVVNTGNDPYQRGLRRGEL